MYNYFKYTFDPNPTESFNFPMGPSQRHKGRIPHNGRVLQRWRPPSNSSEPYPQSRGGNIHVRDREREREGVAGNGV